MQRLITFLIAGVFAQLVDGALGMAYGVTASTLILSTGGSVAAASASVHLAEVGTTLVSGVSHWRFGNVNWRTVRWIGIPGALGGFAGASVLGSIDGDVMKPWVAGLLLCLGAYVLVRFAFGAQRKALAENHLKGRYLSPLGLVAGFVDAVGGGGWGPVTTPALMTAGRMEPRKAVGSASASEFLVAVSASAGFLLALGREGVDFALAGALLVGGAIAAPVAAWIVHRLDARALGSFVGTLLVLTNLRTLMLEFGVAGPLRLLALVTVASVGATLGVRTLVRSRRTARVLGAVPAPTPG